MDLKCGRYLLVFVTHLIGVTLIVKLAGCICPCLTVYHYTGLIELVTCFFVAVLTFRFSKQRYLNDKVHPDKKAVLITGCDSGFGHNLAKRLDSEGFRVFACCLFPSGDGAIELQKNCSKKLQILELDVTKDESVKKVLEHVQENLAKDVLWALVNNAGMTTGYTVELSPIQAFRDCLEVNTIGPVRMAKAFLPLLRKSKGRIVNVTSIAGRQILPFVSPYTMSKFASVAFNDCLRIEMDIWKVKVISIEPDFFQTNILNEQRIFENLDSTFAFVDDHVKSDYGQEYFRKVKECMKYIYCITSPDIHIVVDSMDSAITDEYPNIIYRPSGSIISKVAFFLALKLCGCIQGILFKILAFGTGYPKPKAA